MTRHATVGAAALLATIIVAALVRWSDPLVIAAMLGVALMYWFATDPR